MIKISYKSKKIRETIKKKLFFFAPDFVNRNAVLVHNLATQVTAPQIAKNQKNGNGKVTLRFLSCPRLRLDGISKEMWQSVSLICG